MAALLGQVGQIEDENPSGIVRGEVVVDVGVVAVLDFDACHVVLGDAVAHDDVFTLADVNAGVRRADRDTPVDEHVGRFDGIQAVGAVGGLGAAGPFRPHVDEADAVRALDLDGVADGVLDGEVAQDHAVAGDQETLAAGVLVRK